MNEKDFNKEETDMAITPQELIDKTSAKVVQILKEKFPDYIDFDDGTYTVSRGSSTVIITVRPFTENETCVEISSNMVVDVDLKPELMKFLLRKNAELHFGAFGILFDNTIVFSNSIAGSNLDANELSTSLNAVMIISDHYDNEIVKEYGGKLYKDAFEEDM